jgi:hypothetical protein
MAEEQGCQATWGVLPRHEAHPFVRRQVSLSKVLPEAQELFRQHGGRASGFMGHGTLHFSPEFGLPRRETAGPSQDPGLALEFNRLLESLP